MLEQFKRYISEKKLWDSSHHRLLLAISGGVDSMVLADLLKHVNVNFAFAHVNFGLRGEASDKDEELVKKVADAYGIPFYRYNPATTVYAQDKGISTQMAARELRYAWFEQLMKEEGYHYLLTAHHADDALETSLLNLSRGTGIKGITGIALKSDTIIRPLLFANKEEIVEYATSNGLEWREDASNASDKYVRNKIRHRVIPTLKKINPQVVTHFNLTTDRLEAAAYAFNEQVEKLKKEYVSQQGDVLHIDKQLLSLPQGLVFLQAILEPYGFQYPALKAHDFTNSGAVLSAETYVLLHDREALVLQTKQDFQPDFELLTIEKSQTALSTVFGKITISHHQEKPFSIERDKQVALLDADLLQWPLTLRVWERGDRFRPLGMKGEKKVSDFMIDAKIPVNLKNRQLVLTSADQIVWLVGHRIDDRFKVSDKTNSLVRIHFDGII